MDEPKLPEALAEELRWAYLRVCGALGLGNIRTLGNPEDDADLRQAVEALRRIRTRRESRKEKP